MVLDPTKFVLPDGAPVGGQQPMLSAPVGPADVALIGDVVDINNLFVGDSLVTQEPPDEATPIQVEFGPAIGTGGDPAQLLLNGGVQINTPGSYFMVHTFTVGRASSGTSAQINLRALINGTQIGNTFVYRMDDDEQSTMLAFTSFREYAGADVLTYEVARDSFGPNDGGLFAYPVNTIGWNGGFSAQVSVNQVLVG